MSLPYLLYNPGIVSPLSLRVGSARGHLVTALASLFEGGGRAIARSEGVYYRIDYPIAVPDIFLADKRLRQLSTAAHATPSLHPPQAAVRLAAPSHANA